MTTAGTAYVQGASAANRVLDKPSAADRFADPDFDGLTNFTEFQIGTNPRNADSDGNGVTDLNDTIDSDGDGLSDGLEIALGLLPGNPDTDSDGFVDGQDAAPFDPNVWTAAPPPGTHTAAPVQESNGAEGYRNWFERTLGDGTVEIYALGISGAGGDGSYLTPGRYFITEIRHPAGLSTTYHYDGSSRITHILHAGGGKTVFGYAGEAGDSFRRIASVMVKDAGEATIRSATFAYDEMGRLSQITDAGGISSTIEYEPDGDVITALVTPLRPDGVRARGIGVGHEPLD